MYNYSVTDKIQLRYIWYNFNLNPVSYWIDNTLQ